MQPLDYIKLNLGSLKKEANDWPYPEDDIRQDFFGMMYDVLDNYYKGGSFLALTSFMGDRKVLFEKETEVLSAHIQSLVAIASHPVSYGSFRNNINRGVLTGTWSTFEFCITVICEHVLSELIIKELLDEQYIKIIDTLNGIEISEKVTKNLYKQFSKKHLTHVSINRKCDKLFKLVEGKYSRDLSADKEFLAFYGKYRNSMHSNYIYYGNDYSYGFQGVNFIFENNNTVRHGKFDLTYHFNLALELKEVFKALVLGLDFKQIIPHPIKDAP